MTGGVSLSSWMDYCRWIRIGWWWWRRLDRIKSDVVNRWWHDMVEFCLMMMWCCRPGFDDDATDANADDTAAFLSGTSINICWPSWFSLRPFDDSLDKTLFDTVVSGISFSFCLVSRSSFLCRPWSSLLFYPSSLLHQSSLAAADDTGDFTVDGKQRGLFRSSTVC